ncbi:hypothetical protein KFE96_06080 [Kordiimonas sp. SCSIO 12603]|uniref:hypothetical protein n=1 Tax=Kordiimonas sp. SCSIO 12603 TaxID=2829596 RepID=UPI002103B4B7|nr:hypothetical protein [Kordiimonas sp. SCSIO 12603]UTW59870.1 hypothetical protein KFE96_06080 [Kordiimonas sp. SCSIO 12603]
MADYSETFARPANENVSMWAAAKSGFSYLWQLKRSLFPVYVGYSIFYFIVMYALEAMGLGYMTLAENGFEIGDHSAFTLTIFLLLNLLLIWGTSLISFYIYSSFVGRRDEVAPRKKGSFIEFFKYDLIVTQINGFLGTFTLLYSSTTAVIIWGVIGFALQPVFMRLRLGLVSAAVGGQENSFSDAWVLGDGLGWRMFWAFFLLMLGVGLGMIVLETILGWFVGFLGAGTEQGVVSFQQVWQGLQSGLFALANMFVTAAFYCALCPEYGFRVNGVVQSVNAADPLNEAPVSP